MSDPPKFDPDVLTAQLDAVRVLPASDQRTVGEVLGEYGRMLIESADRLARLQEWLARRGVQR